MPPEPQDAPTGQQDPLTPSQIVAAAADGTLPEYVDLGADEPELHEVDPGELFVEDVPTVEAVELPPLPRGNAGRAEWAAYAQEHLHMVVTSDQTRNEIRDDALHVHAAALARMPQPAVTGGRLDTPEDEPATETVADDPDTRTR